MRDSLVIGSIVLVLLSSAVRGQTTSAPATRAVRSIPDDYQFVPTSSISTLPASWQNSIAWPGMRLIEEERVDPTNSAVRAAVASTVRWARRVLQPQWIPDLSALAVLPLQGEHQGYDVVRFRYEINGYRVQFESVSWAFAVVVQPTSAVVGASALTVESAKRYVGDKIDQFLRDPDRVKDNCMNLVAECAGGVRAHPDVKGDVDEWWGLVSWWTDGSTVYFSAGKSEKGPVEPRVLKHWFTTEQTNSPELSSASTGLSK